MQSRDIVIGMDIGGTKTKIGLVDRQGNVLNHGSFPSRSQEKFSAFLASLSKELDNLRARVKNPLNLLGVGIGAPNANFYTGKMENPVNFKWGTNVPVVDAIGDLLNVPTVMTNDANAAAVGELRFGRAKGMKDFVMITLGTGLGSGLVVDGKLVHGKHGLAGEMGHIVVRPDGRTCNCGNKGCLETYASATGIKRTVFKLMSDMNGKSPLRQVAFNELTAKMITEAALAGDRLAQRAFTYTGTVLGTKLADTVAYLNPEAIILSGGLTQAGHLLLEPTLVSMNTHLFPQMKGKAKLLLSKLDGANTAVLGAAALSWEHLDTIEKKTLALA